MYQVVDKIPKTWDVKKQGKPVLVLEDEYGGQSVVAVDDHCLVLYNGSGDREFQSVSHWYKEAVLAVATLVASNPSFVENWYTS